MCERVAADICKWNEHTPLNEEDPQRSEREDRVAEDAEVGKDVLLAHLLGREAGPDTQVGDNQEDEVTERDHARRPRETDAWE